MALPKYRGAINNGFQFSIGIGAISANLINVGAEKIKGGWGWRISLGMAAVPALLLTIGALLLPETPNSLIQRNQDREKTKLLLQRIRGTTDVQEELDDLIKASANSTNKDSPLKKITQKKHRPHLIMAIFIPFFQQLTGINVVTFYAPVLFRTIGLGESAALLSAVMVSLIGTSSTFISMLTVDKFGRRFMLLFGGIQMLVTQVTIGGVLAVHFGDHGKLSKGYAYLVLTMIGFFVAGFNWSWGPMASLISSEIFPLEIRSIGQSVTVALTFLFIFIVAQTFLPMLCQFKYGIFFFFGGWLAVMTLFIYFFLPETNSIPIEKIERVWKKHWFWKSFVKEDSS